MRHFLQLRDFSADEIGHLIKRTRVIKERFKIAFEYGFHNQDRPNLGAVQAELVF